MKGPRASLLTHLKYMHSIRRLSVSKRATPYLFLLPVVASLGFLIYNIGLNFYESTQYHLLAYPMQIKFIGLENYITLFRDAEVISALQRSLVWVFGTVFPPFVLGFMLALLLNQQFRFRRLYRVLVLSPWAVSGVVGSLMWTWIFNGPFGVLNDALIQMGFSTQRHPWLADPNTAMPAVIISSIWRGIPFFAITILAGLQAISKELYEACEIDGADVFQKFRYITLPLLKNILVLTTLVRAIWSFNWIENIFLMTYGGPARATTTWAFLLFQRFYDAGDVGYTAAMSVATLLFLVVFTVVYLKLSQSMKVETN